MKIEGLRSIIWLWCLVMMLIIAGCGGKQPQFSGFLGNYADLKPGPKGGPDLIYVKPGADFSRYHKVMLDKVVLYLTKEAQKRGIQPDELKALADAFEKELVAQLSPAYPLVTSPGPDVLRIRIAITDVKPSRPGLGTVGAVLPVGMAANLVSNAATGSSLNVGSATIEAEFLDSSSGEVLGKLVDRETGSTYDTATLKGEWGHTKKAFHDWAVRLRKWLDRVHGKK